MKTFKEFVKENLHEVAGFTLNKKDKEKIDLFVKAYWKDASEMKSKNISVYGSGTSWLLEIGSSGKVGLWKDGNLNIGEAYGNVTQTVVNALKKSAKVNKIDFKELDAGTFQKMSKGV